MFGVFDLSPHCVTRNARLWINWFVLDSSQHTNATSQSSDTAAGQAERCAIRPRELVRPKDGTHQARFVVIGSAEKHVTDFVSEHAPERTRPTHGHARSRSATPGWSCEAPALLRWRRTTHESVACSAYPG